MINDLLIYLLQVSLAIGLVAGLYKLFFEKLTFFSWNRYYILVGLIAALAVPLLPSSLYTEWSLFDQRPDFGTVWLTKQLAIEATETVVPSNSQIPNEHNQLSLVEMISWILLVAYAIGGFYKIYVLLKNLAFVSNLRRSAKRIDAGSGYTIYTQEVLPSFSFGQSIFLHKDTAVLSREELDLVIRHERAHVRLRHTWDIIFVEITCAFFWFNPFLVYMSKSLKAVHEYQADSHVTDSERSTAYYGKLIIKLASAQPSYSLINTFSDSQIFNRIKMLTKPKSGAMQKLKFLWSLPAMAIIVLVCSCLRKEEVDSAGFAAKSEAGEMFNAAGLKIGKITWKGNTKYTDQELNDILGVKSGNSCDTTRIFNQLEGYVKANGKDVVSLYMDRGYLFFRVEPRTKINGNIIDLSFDVYEGSIATIGKVTFVGIKKVDARELIEKIETKPGELFSRSKLNNSKRILSEMGKFDPQSVSIQPKPLFGPGPGKIDIKFTVKEI